MNANKKYNVTKRTSFDFGKSFAILILLTAFFFIQCSQPSPNGGPDNSSPATNPASGIEDQELLAGSSSRTTWPPSFADSTEFLDYRTDSILTIIFSDSSEQPSSLTEQKPLQLTGIISLFKSSHIPAIDSNQGINWEFSNQQTLKIGFEKIKSFQIPNRDTIEFTLNIETNSQKVAYILGLKYSVKSHQFISPLPSPHPVFSGHFIPFEKSKHFFHGNFVDQNSVPASKGKGKSTYSLYIPGTTFFSTQSLDAPIHFGPLPFGDYPFRLLRITEAEIGSKLCYVDIFEINGETIMGVASIYKVGPMLLNYQSPVPISIRNNPTKN